MAKVRFRNLSDEQKALLCNGCGGKGGWFNPPDFMFEASCNHHEFNYWLGYRESDRKRADVQFYEAMKRDVRLLKWWRRPAAYVVAYTYYRAVRWFAKSHFHYGSHERTMTDMLAATKAAKNGNR